MSNFCPDQGRTRVCGKAYVCTPQPETRGERRAGQKGPFMDGHYNLLLYFPIEKKTPYRSYWLFLVEFIFVKK